MLSSILEGLIKSDARLLKSDGSINQNAAARAFGINQPTLSRIMSGETQEPKAKVVEAISSYFGIEPAELRGEKAVAGVPESMRLVQPRLSKDEELLLSLYRSLSYATQKMAIRVVAAMKD